MGADYMIAVTVRYGLFLLAAGIARQWVLPLEWADSIAGAILVYLIVVVQTEPAAQYARRAPAPWFAWTFLCALCAHAFCAAAVYALLPITDLRYEDPHPGGMRFEALWVNEPSILEVGSWVVLYALASAVWAVLIGAAARAVWGTVPATSALLRIGKRGAGPISPSS